MKELQEIITNISVLLLGTGMYFVYSKLKKIITNRTSHHDISGNSIEMGKTTKTLLGEIVRDYDCNRAFIIEFHNGDSFSSVMPNWKLSITYEIVDSRTKRISEKFQNIRASLMVDIISGCSTKDYPEGVSCYENTEYCCDNSLIAFDVDEMENTYAKGILQYYGSKYLFGKPLKRDDKTIGILFIDYTRPILLDLIKKQKCSLCDKANEIASMWELFHKENYKPKKNLFTQFLERLK